MSEELSEEGPRSESGSPSDLKEWAIQVSTHLGRARHQLAELAAQQNALITRAIDEGIDLVRTAPTPDLQRVASEGLEALETARKTLSSLAQLPTDQLVQVAKSQAEVAVENATDLAGAGAAALLQASTRLLDQVEKKNDQLADSVRGELNLDENSAAAALVDFSRQLVSNYVEVQKRWIELGLQLPFIRSHVTAENKPPATEAGQPVSPPASLPADQSGELQ